MLVWTEDIAVSKGVPSVHCFHNGAITVCTIQTVQFLQFTKWLLFRSRFSLHLAMSVSSEVTGLATQIYEEFVTPSSA